MDIPMECDFECGDLLVVSKELLIRKDGFTFTDGDCDAEGRIPTAWLDGADVLPEGTYCTFVRRGAEDLDYALVLRDLLGRALSIRLSYLQRLSSIEDAVESDDV
jgi:hypothetical protein